MPITSDEMRRAIRAYYQHAEAGHSRYRSWEHCYAHFQTAGPEGVALERDQAALHLGFYLASWGMYRGSSFLLQHDYTVHRGIVDFLSQRHFRELWRLDAATETSVHVHELVLELAAGIRRVYTPFAARVGSMPPTPTLLTKVMLGTLGCVPATDNLFQKGFKAKGLSFSDLNGRFLKRVFAFCRQHRRELVEEQRRIERRSHVRYPLMKLVDMCFWQIGYEMSPPAVQGRLAAQPA
jgi:hypothetical protein